MTTVKRSAVVAQAVRHSGVDPPAALRVWLALMPELSSDHCVVMRVPTTDEEDCAPLIDIGAELVEPKEMQT